MFGSLLVLNIYGENPLIPLKGFQISCARPTTGKTSTVTEHIQYNDYPYINNDVYSLDEVTCFPNDF